MKLGMRLLALSLIVTLAFVAGCAKKPEAEIAAAKAAVDAVVAEGGEKFASAETKGLNDSLSAALTEVDTQEKKFFKSFDQAKTLLAKVTADATALKTEVAARKEAAKNKANESLTAATAAVEDAKKWLAKAPTGKDTKADIEAMKADLAGLEKSLAEVQPLIAAEDYLVAAEKADIITAKSTEITEQVKKAIEKKKAPAKKK